MFRNGNGGKGALSEAIALWFHTFGRSMVDLSGVCFNIELLEWCANLETADIEV